MESQVKNLGQIAAIIISPTQPEVSTVLWYDETVSSGCPIKYRDPKDGLWKPLKD